ncbi:MAG: amidophosphoribosyltransferase [Candidatus Omnitrophica bacterium]|nr:amidophosphoribosyltransferase [Candidatus Omnitrophota bacterium]MDD5487989.1 amidophosphoribosyltransferase [Candidatus Omnitrophota bacterium]
MDKKEYCGIFGIYKHPLAVDLTYLGLYSLQHRGEESCGIAVSDGKNLKQLAGMGLVSDVFSEKSLHGLRGTNAIGHVRYSTTGSSILRNAQPFMINHNRHSVSIAHNGNLTNAVKLRRALEKEGAIFQTTMDSEIVLHLLVRSKKDTFEERLADALKKCDGAFSMLFLTKDKMVGVRDPHGFRPLCLGIKNGSYVMASETCSLDLIDAKFVREVEPGEVISISHDGMSSIKPFDAMKRSSCIFEFIYFARPDSHIFGDCVHNVRKRLGRKLAEEHPVDADIVMAIPDSGNEAALGYSERSGIPFEFGIIRNHYIGRTFIQPSQEMRKHGVKIKLNPIKDALKGKRVIVVEDSIVRGTTTGGRIRAIREAGVKEIHMRISCPPIRFPCFYGIDFPSSRELIANQLPSIDEIGRSIGVDSLKYISLDGMLEAVAGDKDGFCTACFSGDYPTKMGKRPAKSAFEKKAAAA